MGRAAAPTYVKRRPRGYSSYEDEVSKAPDNLVGMGFHADAPDILWLTDIAKFRLPAGGKVYPSVVVDCFDDRLAARSIGRRPDKRLANSNLEKAVAQRRPGCRATIHSDRDGHCRWPRRIAICDDAELAGGMSTKGRSSDNAAREGFFGRLKNEFFRYRDWSRADVDRFIAELDALPALLSRGAHQEIPRLDEPGRT